MYWDVDVRRGQKKWAEYIISCIEEGKPLPKPWAEKTGESKRIRPISRQIRK
jgi:hypothetical protein